jgi:hypothetical protein
LGSQPILTIAFAGDANSLIISTGDGSSEYSTSDLFRRY